VLRIAAAMTPMNFMCHELYVNNQSYSMTSLERKALGVARR
jgi:hypothetical protein